MIKGWKLGLIFMATNLAGMPCTTLLPPPSASASSPISRCRLVAFAPRRCQRRGHRENIYIRLFGCKPLLLLEASEFKNANQFAAVYIKK
jgi:hypothetical protein